MTTAAPYGWSPLDPKSVSYEFGEARYGKAPNDIPASATGEQGGEDDYHSQYVDPDGEFGAAKVGGGMKSSFGGEEGPDVDGKPPFNTGSIDLPFGHKVIEHGRQNYREYFLVQNIKDEKFYVVIPNIDEKGTEYRSSPKPNRVSALEDAYRIMSASLPDSALAQLRRQHPETPALSPVEA